MKISGFTFIRNGNALGYPFAPSIRSLLPLCDEVIVNVPRSTDGTLDSVKAIGEPKIRIVETAWDDKAPAGDPVIRGHTNLALEQCTGDWCVCIQGDEVLHESTIPAMRAAMERELNNTRVQGLLVDYTHFYGSFWTYGYSHGWYRSEIRVMRRDPTIRAMGGAQSFETTDGRKLRVKHSGGSYLHYGHALRPDVAQRKYAGLAELYNNQDRIKELEARQRVYEPDHKVKRFTGTHPAVMRDLVAAADWTYESPDPFIRVSRKYFWKDVAYQIERFTGLTLGVRRNYRLVK